jgi:hypothetical protein
MAASQERRVIQDESRGWQALGYQKLRPECRTPGLRREIFNHLKNIHIL